MNDISACPASVLFSFLGMDVNFAVLWGLSMTVFAVVSAGVVHFAHSRPSGEPRLDDEAACAEDEVVEG